MSFIPYSCQDIDESDVEAVVAAMRSENITQGSAVTSFEQLFAKQHDFSHAVAVSSATAGLHIACLALDIGPGSRVWTSPNSFLASANCALYCGATVDFVDIDPVSRNMAISALEEKLERASRAGLLPHAVIPVDFAGLPCDLMPMRALADRYGFKIIEDASHATGARYLGRPVGSEFADLTVFSFHAVKIVTTAEGGVVATQDPEIDRRLRLLRSHGMTRDPFQMDLPPEGAWVYQQISLGFNYRMTDLQAALGCSQIRRLNRLHQARLERVRRYNELLKSLPLILPLEQPGSVSAWHLYVVEIDEERTSIARANVFAEMRAAQIGVNVHYIPIHTQPFYRRLGFNTGDFPFAERYYSRAISLPLFPALTDVQQDRVVSVLTQALSAQNA